MRLFCSHQLLHAYIGSSISSFDEGVNLVGPVDQPVNGYWIRSQLVDWDVTGQQINKREITACYLGWCLRTRKERLRILQQALSLLAQYSAVLEKCSILEDAWQ